MSNQGIEREQTLRGLMAELRPVVGDREVVDATWRRHSNDVGRVELDDGRVLMVKVGLFDWTAPRFRAERRAARRLHDHGIIAPRHLDAPDRIAGRPMLCYWRIDMETLATVWPRSSEDRWRAAARGWGRLLRRVHAVPVDGCGPLGSGERRRDRVEDYMAADLVDRLRPAVQGSWPAGLRALDAAADALPELGSRLAGAPNVLLHGDPHAGNVMCRPTEGNGGAISCDGLIDLETAAGGPRELDLAHARVLHGPLFAQPLPDGWFDELRRGYGMELEPFAMRWFEVYHLLNLGFFSALVGDHEHAAVVARAVNQRAADLNS